MRNALTMFSMVLALGSLTGSFAAPLAMAEGAAGKADKCDCTKKCHSDCMKHKSKNCKCTHCKCKKDGKECKDAAGKEGSCSQHDAAAPAPEAAAPAPAKAE